MVQFPRAFNMLSLKGLVETIAFQVKEAIP